MDEQQPQNEQQTPNPFADPQAASQVPPLTAPPVVSNVGTNEERPNDAEGTTPTSAEDNMPHAEQVQQVSDADAPAQAPVADSGNAQPQGDTSSTSPAKSSDDSSSATSESNVAQPDPAVAPQSIPNVVTAPIETVAAEDADQSPATAPQPPQATIVATGDPDQPVKVQQIEQPALIPDPDPKAEDGAQVPNPNVVTSSNAEIPATLNPDATSTPAPMTPAERVAHIEIQQNTAPGESVTATQLSGDYVASASSQAEAAAVPVTHQTILARLVKDLEGIAAMGKSEIIAVLGIVKARFDELEDNKDAD